MTFFTVSTALRPDTVTYLPNFGACHSSIFTLPHFILHSYCLYTGFLSYPNGTAKKAMRDADTDPASSSNVTISGRQALIGASSRFLQDSREEMAEMFVKHGLRRCGGGLYLYYVILTVRV